MSEQSPSSSAILVVLAIIAGAALLWMLLPTDARPAPDANPRVAADDGRRASEQSASNAAAAADGKRTRIAEAASSHLVESSDEDARRLWGRVVRAADESPIAGADVRLLYVDADQFWNLDLEYGKQVEELAHAKTGADGRFAFPVQRSRKHRIEVRAIGYPNRTVENCIGGAEIVITLADSASVHGLVLDSASKGPIIDARVRLAVRGQRVEVAKGRTDSAGRFQFSYLPATSVYVQVKAPAYPEKWESLDVRAGQSNEITILLEKGRRVSGRVIDNATRAPIAGAQIADSWTMKHAVQSAADGRFTIGGLETSRFSLFYVSAAGYAAFASTIPMDFTGELIVEMEPGGGVHGRLVTANGEAPGPVYLAVGASFEEAPGLEHTDWIRGEVTPSGVFRVSALRPDQHYWLYVRGRGYGTRVYALPRRVATGESTDLGDVVLHPAGGIEGRVVDENGAPLAGLEVSIRGMNGDARKWVADKKDVGEVSQFVSRSVDTDRNGGFRFTGVSGGRYTLSTRARGHTRSSSKIVNLAEGTVREDVVLEIRIGLAIAGRVVFPDSPTGGAPAARSVWLKLSRYQYGQAHATVDADGKFRFIGLEDGEHEIRLFHATGLDGWTLKKVTGVRAGTTDLRLEFVRAGRVAGQVVGSDGKATRARIWFQPTGETQGVTIHSTDADGKFELDVPPDATGTLYAARAGSETRVTQSVKVENVVAGQGRIVIRLK